MESLQEKRTRLRLLFGMYCDMPSADRYLGIGREVEAAMRVLISEIKETEAAVGFHSRTIGNYPAPPLSLWQKIKTYFKRM